MAINRNAASPKVDAYFGTSEWRPFWERQDRAGLRRLYKERLASLGYVEQADVDRLISTPTGQDLYYLIPASKVPAARSIWRWVLDQPDATNQGRLI